MSDAANHRLFVVRETTPGQIPANPALKRVRNIGCSLGLAANNLESGELKNNRMPGDVIQGTKSVGGSVETEVSYGSHDDLIEAGLCGTWSTPPVAITGDWQVNLGSYTGAFMLGASLAAWAALPAGSILRVAGFANEVNNGFFRVAGVYADYVEITNLDGSPAAIVDENPANTVRIEPLPIVNPGATRRSFSFVRHFADQADGAAKPWHVYTGCEINTLALSLTAEGIVTLNYGIVGNEPKAYETAPAGAVLGQATTSIVMTGFNGMVRESEEQVHTATEITLNLDNGITGNYAIGSRVPVQKAIQLSNLTGQLSLYFDNAALLEKYYNDQETDLVFSIADKLGNGYLFVVPRIHLNGGQQDTKGPGTLILPIPFKALELGTTGRHIQVCRFTAPGA